MSWNNIETIIITHAQVNIVPPTMKILITGKDTALKHLPTIEYNCSTHNEGN